MYLMFICNYKTKIVNEATECENVVQKLMNEINDENLNLPKSPSKNREQLKSPRCRHEIFNRENQEILSRE